MAAITRFQVEVESGQVADLRTRLSLTRWPRSPGENDWSMGADVSAVRALCDYWADGFDWTAFEGRLNRFDQYRTEVDGQPLHFYHVRSREPDARPLLISHGWPGSPVEFLDVMGPLTDPAAHGGDPRQAFHLVVPSLPGFGFSGPTLTPDYDARRMARAFDTLMVRLGYDAYLAHGGDKGTLITMVLATSFPERVRAVHLCLAPAPPPDPDAPKAGLGPADLAILDRNAAFAADETGYQQLQRTKPQSLAVGLTDSPAGLAAWMMEKFRSWSDCNGDLFSVIPRDRLLDNISLYWLTGTIGSSMQIYFADHGPGRQQPLPTFDTPMGHARFPREIIQTPRAWVEARYNLIHWSEPAQGGHFPAMEVPELLVADLRACFEGFR